MATKRKNLSNRPCPQVLDVINRPIGKGNYVIYRPGGGSAIRIGKVMDIYMTETSGHGYTNWIVKAQLKAIALFEVAKRSPKARGSTIEVFQCSVYNGKPGRHPHSQPPGPPARWISCTVVGDPAMHAAAVKAIP